MKDIKSPDCNEYAVRQLKERQLEAKNTKKYSAKILWGEWFRSR